MNWTDVRDELLQENERILFSPPEEIVKIFKYGIVESRAGTNGQAFTAMVFVEGDCRSLAFYGSNNVVKLCDDPTMTLDALKSVAKTFIPLSSEFLGYCGLNKLWTYVQHMMAVIDTVESKEDLKDLITALTLYAGTLNSWIQHYFPWKVGVLFPQVKSADVKEMARLSNV